VIQDGAFVVVVVSVVTGATIITMVTEGVVEEAVVTEEDIKVNIGGF